MIEGNGYESAEAGPSRPRYDIYSAMGDSFPSGSRSRSTVRDSDDDDLEEVLRENEAEALEDIISTERSSQSRPSLPIRRSTAPKVPHASLSPINLPLHTSSSEIFNLPPISPEHEHDHDHNHVGNNNNHGGGGGKPNRPITYSSLPPSPRVGEAQFDLSSITIPPPLPSSSGGGMGVGMKGRGLGIKDLDTVLDKLNSASSPTPEHAHDLDGEDEETFWPARSRRNTIGEESSPYLIPSSTLGGATKATADLNSPTSDGDGSLPADMTFGGSKTEVLGIWDLLKDEMGAEDWDGWIVDGKWERISNFLAVPLAVEKTTFFGALLCLDGFLYNFTVLPIRSIFALTRIITNIIRRRAWWPIPTAHLHSILRSLLLFIPTVILLMGTDASKMYHTVRGQDTIKLYVIFNALEIADRLCCAFGQDVLDTLFARETLSPSVRKRGKGRKRQQARPVFFFALSLGYVLVHSLIFFYMLVSLNVAINSYDYTLLSLLISNQFVEIKGSVFKKFEKENLFQIMCADIVERFQLSLMLSVIAIRNMIEMAGSEIAFLPKSFIRGKSLVDSILSPVLFVICSEMVVDWLKHAFITKFNHVRASVYERFTDVLAKDVLMAGSTGGQGRSRMKGRNHQVLLDQSPLVARRLGFASIPLACLVIRIGAQAIGMLTTSSHHNDESMNDLTSRTWAWTTFKWASWIGVGLCAWGCLVFVKVILGLSLLSFSAMRQEGMDQREAEDSVNDFGRSAVGESKEETEYNKQTSRFLSHPSDDLPDYPSPTTLQSPATPAPVGLPKSALINNARRFETNNGNPDISSAVKEGAGAGAGPGGGGGGVKKGKKWKLEEVERWTMVKRIW
ncbi:hypothetical protein CI109_101200 [Kwoniella shandongensis]|uniref:Uncharacterized protein n=1 Tax=Kwoniella shandongensis TaxID=1734106 RepID=A0A5M6BTN7_9TREE|nr:uncharacterized protein CI109_005482 [Kwoniella shandongensis]KAA5526204.1 hypothetical protein CI109_005482 [Kwoniella shandongensis]